MPLALLPPQEALALFMRRDAASADPHADSLHEATRLADAEDFSEEQFSTAWSLTTEADSTGAPPHLVAGARTKLVHRLFGLLVQHAERANASDDGPERRSAFVQYGAICDLYMSALRDDLERLLRNHRAIRSHIQLEIDGVSPKGEA